jgi:hypothetical protein
MEVQTGATVYAVLAHGGDERRARYGSFGHPH